MKQVAKALSLLLFLCLSQASVAADLAVYKTAILEDTGNVHKVTITFDSPIDYKSVVTEYINQTVQLYIPGTSISEKKHSEISNSKVEGIYSYKLGSKGIRTRIIYKKPIKAEELKGNIKFSSSGNTLTVEINHKGIGSDLARKDLPKVLPISLNRDGSSEQQLPSILFEVASTKNYTATEIVEKELGVEFKAAKEVTTNKLSNSDIQSEIDRELSKRGLFDKKTTKKPKIAAKKIIGTDSKKELDESEIPILLGAGKVKESGSSPLFRVFMSLGILILLVGGFVLFTKWWGKYQKKSLGDNHIHVVTQHYIGPKKSIAIIRVAGESILVGITDHNISMLKTLALIDEEVTGEVQDDFEGTLNSMAEQELVESAPKEKITITQRSVVAGEKDEFNYGQIREMVSSKLKKMRTL